METVEVVMNLFQNLGVPVACLIFCGWFIVRQEDKHNTEVDTLSKALNSNTQAMTEMKSMLQTFMDYVAKMSTGGSE
jgi:hypothetical protein